MKIIVCVKQVPDTSGKVAVNPDGTLNRASMAAITNPDDLNAVEAALVLKEQTGAEVIVVSMGPPPAEGMLREVMARGVDRAILVSAREFGGSDTYATSQILAAAIDKIGVDKDDIVMCGRQAIDGDTAQVGPQIAEKLGVPQVSYVEKVETLAPEMALDMSVMNPVVLVGIFVGACLAFIFAAITMGSVGKAAHSVVLEVRRQFKEIPGIIQGTADADFARCVDLCTRASLKEMVVPTLIAVGVPIVGGLLLGPAGVIGLLCGATASGFLLAVFMSNSGGSWDNAKKYVEAGHYGGKGSKNDKSAIVGDTIGDPFKDTSGPAINILIKLLSMVSIVFATVVVNFHVFG